jgi:hypothetical protein
MALLVNPANRLAEGLVRDSHAAARMLAFPPEPTRIGVSIAVSAVPLSHVVETSRLAHHIKQMSRKEPKRSGGSDQNKAIARWDNEGGAPKAPQEDRNELAPLTNEEEHILRRLGAAVIMQWNDLPTKIQRELFEHASSMGELNHTAELKGQVARFLHQHKDDGRESA